MKMDTAYEGSLPLLTDCGSSVVLGRREVMDAALETATALHTLDPPPPDVLLALLARNKALEGEIIVKLDL